MKGKVVEFPTSSCGTGRPVHGIGHISVTRLLGDIEQMVAIAILGAVLAWGSKRMGIRPRCRQYADCLKTLHCQASI
ncbi:hypothetical protein [Methylobacter sp.]|uniref:hypothetical protein n=1 Tax=Methylobacter sp. TaxID=2051955 RepID=UPI003DA68CD9